jgi:hypothetical protein
MTGDRVATVLTFLCRTRPLMRFPSLIASAVAFATYSIGNAIETLVVFFAST